MVEQIKHRQRGALGTVAQAGRIGGRLLAGEVVTTASGRLTTPFPRVDFGTERRSLATVRRAEAWLLQNAADEAIAREDAFNAQQFHSVLDRPSQADKDAAEEYLFGRQPPVLPSILRPIRPDAGRGA